MNRVTYWLMHFNGIAAAHSFWRIVFDAETEATRGVLVLNIVACCMCAFAWSLSRKDKKDPPAKG